MKTVFEVVRSIPPSQGIRRPHFQITVGLFETEPAAQAAISACLAHDREIVTVRAQEILGIGMPTYAVVARALYAGAFEFRENLRDLPSERKG